MLVHRSVCERELLDVVFGRTPASFRNDEGYWLLPLHLVIDRHHSSLADVGVSFQHALDVARVNVLTSTVEHFIRAANEIVKAILVTAEDVSCDVESVGRN